MQQHQCQRACERRKCIVKLIALPFGGVGVVAWFWGFLLVAVVIGVLIFFGRRRQKTARAKAAEARAAQFKQR